MRRWLLLWLQRKLQQWYRALQPPPDYKSENRALKDRLNNISAEVAEQQQRRSIDAADFVRELLEARRMSGTGPWRIGPAAAQETDALIRVAAEAARRGTSLKEAVTLREDAALISQGAYGDIELALQNVEWRREVNLSFLEFSRWGIQQIILICRLYFVKHPWIQRGVNIAASYVFGRGVEVSSPDETANEVLQDYFERNKDTLGQVALTDLMRRKYYDGNIFFVSFPDEVSAGTVETRTIDATEIQDIITDPEDIDQPWLYHRQWTERTFNCDTGSVSTATRQAWYPSMALWLQVKGLSAAPPSPKAPAPQQQAVGAVEIMWGAPVLHRKCGAIAKWHFGLPLVYAAIDWAKAGRRFLEACATVKQALAQIAFTLTTKGGQQAIQGAKDQLSTTVGPNSTLWDTNPTAVNASIFASGPGTSLSAFKSTGAGGDPGEVKEFRNMAACVLNVPPTYLADMETSNLATATTLDRPTELGFLLMQEEWREDLVTLARFAVLVSGAAQNGRIREAMRGRKHDGKVIVMEAPRRMSADGTGMEYLPITEQAKAGKSVQVLVTFPAIREGDLPQMVAAIADAMTLGNKGGQVVGVDEKQGVFLLMKQLGIEGAEELLEKMYPETGEDAYDPNRAKEDIPAPVPTAPPINPGGQPQDPGGHPTVHQQATKAAEAFTRLFEVLRGKKRGRAA